MPAGPQLNEKRKDAGPLTWHLRPVAQGPRRLALKNHFVAMVGEYVGTVLFLIFALGGTNVANIPSNSLNGGVNTSQLLYISLSFGFSLAVNAWVFYRVSGGLFNPVVSLGLAVVGVLPPLRAGLLCISQILGGITGAAIVSALLPGSLNVKTTLGGGASVVQGLFIEMFMTAELVWTILMLAAEKHKATFLAPIGIGLSLFIAELVSVYYTGGSLNPARSFGPCVVLLSFESYHWIYWVGPALGSLLAAGFYKFVKYLEYETVVPDQDATAEYPDPMVTPTSDSNGQQLQNGLGRTPTGGADDVAIVGPGIADMLTRGDPRDVYDLPAVRPAPPSRDVTYIDARNTYAHRAPVTADHMV